MRILVTNDDGIYSNGIRAAVKALSSLGEVYVVAPLFQRSASGRAMTLHRPIRARLVDVPGAKVAYGIDGTPTDSVIFALARFGDFDLAVSGINLGENLSTEITVSGTASAAIEAATHEVPSIAISLEVDWKKTLGEGEGIDFSVASHFLKRITRAVLEKGLPEGVDMLNVNVPSNATPETEIAITRLARKRYCPTIEERVDPRGHPYYWIVGQKREEFEPGTDAYALKIERKVSVTPINIDMTARVNFEEVRKVLFAQP
ncbi:Acid phosphatase SurE homolog [Thermococcus kodakarensis KOD1]|uniref:5'-nucleotidase SurE n=1 Tax=Thermococcus kodakarensis (strain ATCC BAA-918 / JCM 12380 / KOD1) TaxID=69014 RepID=SURE_THEKO|nr:5'/3'-nucleotidase SurE [Thermococcus kodakarensis]Q5JE78.1 RecName: Full=5'-nucleotidase SurE; AltName: Full=Nucleoside 5'-monophosphate phosphohydrolase [Thermococcus kodakarensis KOD1]WCN29087.1 5'/3'-nucleotidase SurE [Thermococcus kodakarensis]WCN31391.1 5'/3'-nucleotidase SurE [Thermococcus kodakarensis]BAD85326.1 Acid phosphatase SurE homolog [Thermococcus kodakarensis KOD1]